MTSSQQNKQRNKPSFGAIGNGGQVVGGSSPPRCKQGSGSLPPLAVLAHGFDSDQQIYNTYKIYPY
jgi:hypothetical protein